MIYILSGDIRSGKTTALLDWVEGRNDVDGLLCPDSDNGKRYFLKIGSKEQFELEVEIKTEKTITIGPFHFLKSAFKNANDYLLDASKKSDFKYLVIDELGKLELKNEGLNKAVEHIIPKFIDDTQMHLIFVVRVSLLREVIRYYGIKTYKHITKDDLTENSFT